MYSVPGVSRSAATTNMLPIGSIAAVTANLGENLGQQTLLIMDPRALSRECFARGLSATEPSLTVYAFGSLEEWKRQAGKNSTLSAVLFVLGSRKVTDALVAEEIEKLLREFKGVPVILVAESDDISQIVHALELGVQGYIPSSIGVKVCVEAISLVLAGGIFVPGSSLLSIKKLLQQSAGVAQPPMGGMFTHRQAAVVDALRRGKANKIIAFDLNLRESTVKVHIRNIMKKLKATNRTEVACKINELFPTTT